MCSCALFKVLNKSYDSLNSHITKTIYEWSLQLSNGGR